MDIRIVVVLRQKGVGMSLRDKFTTISKDSWHYRLTRYGLGDAAGIIKRACPYWLVLVPVSSVMGSIRFALEAMYEMMLYVGYYPLMALAWILGWKPRYWRGLTTRVREGNETTLLHKKWSYEEVRHGYVPLLMAPVLTMTPIIIWVFDFGHKQADAITALPVYYIALIAYAGLLAVIALGNAWKYGAWPLVYRAYCDICPELKVVESAPASSHVEPAH